MVELLLTPENVLEILRSYTMYSSIQIGSGAKPIKVIPRYPQVEAVEASSSAPPTRTASRA